MKAQDVNVGEHYKSGGNPFTKNDTYKVLKKLKTVCWVQHYEDGVEPGHVYKNIKYSVLRPI